MCGSSEGAFEALLHVTYTKAFALALPYSDDDDTGGFASVKGFGGEYWPLERMLLGTVPQDKIERYGRLSMEKPRRLEANLTEGHLSSHQSRNKDLDMWGGAVIGYVAKIPAYGYGFSGLTEACDESIDLLVAIKMGNLTVQFACFIAGISKNTIFIQILAQIQADPTNYFYTVCAA